MTIDERLGKLEQVQSNFDVVGESLCSQMEALGDREREDQPD